MEKEEEFGGGGLWGVGYGRKRQTRMRKRKDNEKPDVPQEPLPLFTPSNPPSRDQPGLNQPANQQENVPKQPEQDQATEIMSYCSFDPTPPQT